MAKWYARWAAYIHVLHQESRSSNMELQNIHNYIPVTMHGVGGKYSVVNGLYIPVYNNQTMDISYKKADNSNITIQYCSKRKSWKVYDETRTKEEERY